MKQLAVKLSVNVSPKIRTETLDNIEYIVAPAVLMPEGVHNGSDGPIYYPGKELAKYAAAWNHKPVVINHPTLNGQPASAASKSVIESSQVGFLLNMDYADGKQKGEVWLNKAKTEKIEPKILENLTAGNKTELSTGLFVDNDEKAGKWGVEDYNGTATNYRPDHLALLPDSIGAASNADGAGLLVNSENPTLIPILVRNRISQCRGHADAEKGKLLLHSKPNQTLTVNKLSYQQITSMLEAALRTRFGQPGRSWYGYVLAVYDNSIVFEDCNNSYTTYALGYTLTDTGVTLDSGDPKLVEMIVEYRTTDGGYVANRSGQLLPISPEVLTMNRNDLLSKIIGDGKPFTEAEKDAVIALLVPESGTTNNEDKKPKLTANNGTPAPTEEKPATLEDLYAKLPAEDREMLAEMKATHNETKTKLVDLIANVKGCTLKKEVLQNMSMDTLKGMASLIPQPEQTPLQKLLNFGAAAPVANSGGKKPPTLNSAGGPAPAPSSFTALQTKTRKKEEVAA